MPDSKTATASITLPHPPQKVWDALTRPEIVKQWMFGTEMAGDLEPGGTVFYRGEWSGAPYEDRGAIIEIDPPRRLKMNFHSSVSGLPDIPESWQPITYALEEQGDGTRLTVIHENTADAESSEKTWVATLEGLKGVLAGGQA